LRRGRHHPALTARGSAIGPRPSRRGILRTYTRLTVSLAPPARVSREATHIDEHRARRPRETAHHDHPHTGEHLAGGDAPHGIPTCRVAPRTRPATRGACTARTAPSRRSDVPSPPGHWRMP